MPAVEVEKLNGMCVICNSLEWHHTERCVLENAKTITTLIKQTTKSVRIDSLVATNVHTRTVNPVLLAFIYGKIIALVEAANSVETPGIVISHQLKQYRELVRAVPRDGNWHFHSLLAVPSFVTWLREVKPPDLSLCRAGVSVRMNTKLGIDTIEKLATVLDDVYPLGVSTHELYREHIDMAAWLLNNKNMFVRIEGIHDESIIYRRIARHAGTISYRIAIELGEPCAICFDSMMDSLQYDNNLLPQIHATVRATILRDMLQRKYIEHVADAILGYGMLFRINKACLATQFPREALQARKHDEIVNASNLNLVQIVRRRRARNTIKRKPRR